MRVAQKICAVLAFSLFSGKIIASINHLMRIQQELQTADSSSTRLLDIMHEGLLILPDSEKPGAR